MKAPSVPLGFIENSATPGDHIAYFWETDEEFCRGVMFLDAGLRAGEACVVFGHTAANDRVVSELTRLGHNVAELAQRSRLSLLSGKANGGEMLGEIGATFTAMLRSGATLIRLLGNIGWGREGWPIDDEILQFEAEVTTAAKSFPCVVVCMYNVGSVSGRVMLRGAFETHPITCCGGVVQQNPHYVPLPEYLNRIGRGSKGPRH